MRPNKAARRRASTTALVKYSSWSWWYCRHRNAQAVLPSTGPRLSSRGHRQCPEPLQHRQGRHRARQTRRRTPHVGRLPLLATVTYLSLPLSLLVLQSEEVQVRHLQVSLAGFQEAADVPVDAGAWGGVDDICGERRAVSDFFRSCSQRPALRPSRDESNVVTSPRTPPGLHPCTAAPAGRASPGGLAHHR